MVVQHNLTAMNSNRMLNVTTKSQAKATEKLSSGYKINRAADDAAGLSISEKMRKQIRGLTQASSNAQDGISAVQTAEGALNEVQDMLQRMNELAVKSANGTNSSDDRGYIQNEIDQLKSEIGRVAETTKFNETYLLKGDKNADEVKFATYKPFTNETASVTAVKAGAANASATLPATFVYDGTAWKKSDGTNADFTATGYNLTVGGDAQLGDVIEYDGTTATIKEADRFSLYDANGNRISANAIENYFDYTEGATPAFTLKDGKSVFVDEGGNVALNITNLGDILAAKERTAPQELKLHVGADATSNNQISVKLEALTAEGLGIDELRVDGDDDRNSLDAIETIKAAIQKVSTQRSELGAVQNRLEHTIANLDNVVENTTSAESSIRDTDMATQMVAYSNNNILAQAGQAMLAQANQSNQGVLSLLQ